MLSLNILHMVIQDGYIKVLDADGVAMVYDAMGTNRKGQGLEGQVR